MSQKLLIACALTITATTFTLDNEAIVQEAQRKAEATYAFYNNPDTTCQQSIISEITYTDGTCEKHLCTPKELVQITLVLVAQLENVQHKLVLLEGAQAQVAQYTIIVLTKMIQASMDYVSQNPTAIKDIKPDMVYRR